MGRPTEARYHRIQRVWMKTRRLKMGGGPLGPPVGWGQEGGDEGPGDVWQPYIYGLPLFCCQGAGCHESIVEV
jgi:hypothetical protein